MTQNRKAQIKLLEMGNTIFEVKNTLSRINSRSYTWCIYDRFNNTEEKMGKPEDIAMETVQNGTQREKKIVLNNEKESVTVGQCQNIKYLCNRVSGGGG